MTTQPADEDAPKRLSAVTEVLELVKGSLALVAKRDAMTCTYGGDVELVPSCRLVVTAQVGSSCDQVQSREHVRLLVQCDASLQLAQERLWERRRRRFVLARLEKLVRRTIASILGIDLFQLLRRRR